MPLSARETCSKPPSRTVVAAAVLVGLAAAAQAQEDGRPEIAVIPVVVHSSEDPQYLRAGIEDMLVARLEQVGALQVQRVTDISKATTQVDVAIATGREVGADFVLFGSFTRFGQGASLDMQAAATAPGAGGETLREIFVHSGSIGDVIPDLDELVGKVSRFAISDYQEPAAAGSSEARARPSIDKLRRRIDTLERDTREMDRDISDLKKALQQARQAAAGSQ